MSEIPKITFADENKRLVFEDDNPRLVFADEFKKLVFDIVNPFQEGIFDFTFDSTFN